jgi:hypothetical protein
VKKTCLHNIFSLVLLFLLTASGLNAATSPYSSRPVNPNEVIAKKQKQKLYADIVEITKRLNAILPKGIHKSIRENIFRARKEIRFSAMAYSRRVYNASRDYYNKSLLFIKKAEELYKAYKLKSEEASSLLNQIRIISSTILRQGLEGERYSNYIKARRLMISAEYYLSNEEYDKSVGYSKKSIAILKSLAGENVTFHRSAESSKKLSLVANKLIDECRVKLHRNTENIVPGQIRRDYMRAKGFYLKSIYLARNKKYNESIETAKKAIEILDGLKIRKDKLEKEKETAYKSLKKANDIFTVVSRKRFESDEISKFIKAKKLLFRARKYFSDYRFREAMKLADEAYNILKVL